MKDINDLISDNEGLVNDVIKNYYPAYRYDEDIHQEGLIGLWNALLTYNDTNGAKFSTYAYTCIKYSINIAVERMSAMKRKLDYGNICVSLNEPIANQEGDTTERINMIEDTKTEGSYSDLLEFYKGLSRKKQFIMNRKVKGFDTQSIADEMNVSGQTVRRIWNVLQKEVADTCL